MFGELWEFKKLEVKDASNDEIVLNLVGGQVVVTCPHAAENDWIVCLFDGQLTNVGAEGNVRVRAILTNHIRPQAPHHIFALFDH